MTISPACRKNGGKDPCDFLEYVQFINEAKSQPELKNRPRGWDPVDMKPEHVDWTAKALTKENWTGFYNPGRICQGAGGNDVDLVFRKVSQFIQGARYASDIPDNSIKCAEHAVDMWAKLRTWAQGEAFAKKLEKLYPKVDKIERVTKNIGSTGDTTTTINLRKAREQIRQLPGMEKYSTDDDLQKFIKDDPGHSKKVELAKEAKQKITGDCG